MASKIKLGTRYRDSISGFEGVATARYEFLYGCVRICLEGVVKDDGKEQVMTFDEQRLVEVKTGKAPALTATSGGPYPDPVRRDPR